MRLRPIGKRVLNQCGRSNTTSCWPCGAVRCRQQQTRTTQRVQTSPALLAKKVAQGIGETGNHIQYSNIARAPRINLVRNKRGPAAFRPYELPNKDRAPAADRGLWSLPQIGERRTMTSPAFRTGPFEEIGRTGPFEEIGRTGPFEEIGP